MESKKRKISGDEKNTTITTPNDELAMTPPTNLFYFTEPPDDICIYCRIEITKEIKFFSENFGTRSLGYLLSVTLDQIHNNIKSDEMRTQEEKEILLNCCTDVNKLEYHIFYCTFNDMNMEVRDQIRVYKKLRQMVLEDTISVSYNENNQVSREYDVKLLGLLEKFNSKIISLYKDIDNTITN